MFIGLFRYGDDWLIDNIFQPFCNLLRDVFDWSKRVPVAITEAGIGHVLWLISIIFSASGNIFFIWMGGIAFLILPLYWIACLAHLVLEAILGPPEHDRTDSRGRYRSMRYGLWKFCFWAILGVYWFEPQFVYLISQYVLLMLTWVYFLACSNHPKRNRPEPVASSN